MDMAHIAIVPPSPYPSEAVAVKTQRRGSCVAKCLSLVGSAPRLAGVHEPPILAGRQSCSPGPHASPKVPTRHGSTWAVHVASWPRPDVLASGREAVPPAAAAAPRATTSRLCKRQSGPPRS